MREMLGNQYFMARNYEQAAFEFEIHLANHPDDLMVIKKLIFCYIHSKNISLAWNHFIQLVETNISLIIETDPVNDDCPYQELISALEQQKQFEKRSPEFKLQLAMLHLFSNATFATNLFKELESENKNKYKSEISSLLNNINNYFVSKKESRKF